MVILCALVENYVELYPCPKTLLRSSGACEVRLIVYSLLVVVFFLLQQLEQGLIINRKNNTIVTILRQASIDRYYKPKRWLYTVIVISSEGSIAYNFYYTVIERKSVLEACRKRSNVCKKRINTYKQARQLLLISYRGALY